MFGMFSVRQYISYSVEIYEICWFHYHFFNLFLRVTNSKMSDSGPYQDEGFVFKMVQHPLRYILGT